MSIKSAFLNGDHEEEVYVVQPHGFVHDGQESKVLRLHKDLYGLRQAPHAWNAKLDSSLAALGFVKCPSKHTVYTRSTVGSRLLVGVYVDDLIVTGASPTAIGEFRREMMSLFNMSDLASSATISASRGSSGRDTSSSGKQRTPVSCWRRPAWVTAIPRPCPCSRV